MSRARSIKLNGETHWFDTRNDHRKASAEQLELLAAVEDISIDDLVDAGLSQGEVILRIREAIGGQIIPDEVLERKQRRKREAQKQPVCVICGKKGDSTKHHFVPRWLMRELENYQAYSARSICTIPICVECHRDLHMRNGQGAEDKSIVPYLNANEKALAQKMLDDLKDQHPKIFDLITGGDQTTYEGQLLRDYHAGLFRR